MVFASAASGTGPFRTGQSPLPRLIRINKRPGQRIAGRGAVLQAKKNGAASPKKPRAAACVVQIQPLFRAPLAQHFQLDVSVQIVEFKSFLVGFPDEFRGDAQDFGLHHIVEIQFAETQVVALFDKVGVDALLC